MILKDRLAVLIFLNPEPGCALIFLVKAAKLGSILGRIEYHFEAVVNAPVRSFAWKSILADFARLVRALLLPTRLAVDRRTTAQAKRPRDIDTAGAAKTLAFDGIRGAG